MQSKACKHIYERVYLCFTRPRYLRTNEPRVVPNYFWYRFSSFHHWTNYIKSLCGLFFGLMRPKARSSKVNLESKQGNERKQGRIYGNSETSLNFFISTNFFVVCSTTFPSVWLSSVYACARPSVCLSGCLCICLPIHWFIRLPVCVSVHLSVLLHILSMPLFFHPIFHPSVTFSIDAPVHKSICSSVSSQFQISQGHAFLSELFLGDI